MPSLTSRESWNRPWVAHARRDAVPRARDEAVRVDAELARLGRGAAGLRLLVGEALESMGARRLFRRLGFPSLGAYAVERAVRGVRWVEDSRALARRLAKLPKMRAAVLAGDMGWRMAEVLSRRVALEEEGKWLAITRGATVREVLSRLEEEAPKDGAVPAEEARERMVAMTMRVDASEGWQLVSARMLSEAIGSGATDDEFLDGLLAEAWSTMIDRMTPEETERALDGEAVREESEAAHKWREQLAAWRAEAEQRCEGRVDLEVDAGGVDDAALEGMGAWELDARIRELCAELANRDLKMGQLWDRFRRMDGWRRLGFASEQQYVRERVGVSMASLKSRRALARRARDLPEVRDALVTGTIGYEAARVIARVSTAKHAGAWVERAARRTVKHLREEADIAELVATFSKGVAAEPPTAGVVAAVQRAEAWVKSGGTYKEGLLGDSGEDSQIGGGVPERAPRMRLPETGRLAARVTLRFWVSASTRDFFREFERVYERWRRDDVPFIGFLTRCLWETWRHAFEPRGAYADVYARDRHQCVSPVCLRRDATPHHIVKRSEGGSDERENVATLCTECHLNGVHAGTIRFEGTASKPRFDLGSGFLMVDGREARRGRALTPS